MKKSDPVRVLVLALDEAKKKQNRLDVTAMSDNKVPRGRKTKVSRVEKKKRDSSKERKNSTHDASPRAIDARSESEREG